MARGAFESPEIFKRGVAALYEMLEAFDTDLRMMPEPARLANDVLAPTPSTSSHCPAPSSGAINVSAPERARRPDYISHEMTLTHITDSHHFLQPNHSIVPPILRERQCEARFLGTDTEYRSGGG